MAVADITRATATHGTATHGKNPRGKGPRGNVGGENATRERVTRGEAPRGGVAGTVAVVSAAREVGLKRGEFELAVHLGLVRATVERSRGGFRVGRGEIDRLRAEPGFPDGLRARVRTAGRTEAAQLLAISPDRFTGLARAGCVAPITFGLNRYRAICWLYLVDDLVRFRAAHPELLTGRTSDEVRTLLGTGVDWRVRNWRESRINRLLDRTDDPWARTAVLAETLDTAQVAEIVDDPYERAYLRRVRPEPVFGPSWSPVTRQTAARLMAADDPDEILWRRLNLTMELDRAREARPAPRPGNDDHPRPEAGEGGPVREPVRDPEAGPEPVPGLLDRLGLRGRVTARRHTGRRRNRT
ncbi:DUF6397 family protein [Streptomyces sp. DT171]|uniref:DUF6397 family protein n=1 Tax=Streptomyces sp. DT171 TaxID=3416524 RepID=UPI003CE67EBE